MLTDGRFVVRSEAHQRMGAAAGLVVDTQHGHVTQWCLLGDYAAGVEAWTSALVADVAVVVRAALVERGGLVHRV